MLKTSADCVRQVCSLLRSFFNIHPKANTAFIKIGWSLMKINFPQLSVAASRDNMGAQTEKVAYDVRAAARSSDCERQVCGYTTITFDDKVGSRACAPNLVLLSDSLVEILSLL